MAERIFRTGRVGTDGAAVMVLTAQVDIDLETEQAARYELARLRSDRAPVVVDVSSVFVAVIGLRVLLGCIEHVRGSGRPAELVVSRHLQRMAHITGQRPEELRLTVADALVRVRDAGRDGSSAARSGNAGSHGGGDGGGPGAGG
jgi:uncharacterized membrane protein YgcG